MIILISTDGVRSRRTGQDGHPRPRLYLTAWSGVRVCIKEIHERQWQESRTTDLHAIFLRVGIITHCIRIPWKGEITRRLGLVEER